MWLGLTTPFSPTPGLSAPIDSAPWSLEHVKAGRKDSQMRTWQGLSRCWCEENAGVALIPHHVPTASGWRLDWSCLFCSEWWSPLTVSLPQTRRYTKALTCIHSIFLITAITSILQTRTCLRSELVSNTMKKLAARSGWFQSLCFSILLFCCLLAS